MKASRVLKIFPVPYKLIQAQLDSVNYAKEGVISMKGSVAIFGSSDRMIGAESYLVTVVNNVLVSLWATFICRNSAVLPFRKGMFYLYITKRITVGNNRVAKKLRKYKENCGVK